MSKGGFVAVPVVYAAKKRGIPAVIHESDMTPGLANKLCIKKATKVCCNFAATLSHLPAGKAVHTGTPLRKELFTGTRERGLEINHFTNGMPVLLIVGGSTGAQRVNEAVRGIMPKLLETFQVIHICGKGKTDPEFDHKRSNLVRIILSQYRRIIIRFRTIVVRSGCVKKQFFAYWRLEQFK